MTVKQLLKACKTHPFLLLRDSNGVLYGVNSKVALLKTRGLKLDTEKQIWVKSFVPVSFQQYINYKVPFILKKL